MYFLATETTSRRLDITNLSKASSSPSFIRLLSSRSSSAVSNGYLPIALRKMRTASSVGISLAVFSSGWLSTTSTCCFSRYSKASSTSVRDASASTTRALVTSSTVSTPFFLPIFTILSKADIISSLFSILISATPVFNFS